MEGCRSIGEAARWGLLLLWRGQKVLDGGEHNLVAAVARIVGEFNYNRFRAVLWNGPIQILNRPFRLAALVVPNEADALRESWNSKQKLDNYGKCANLIGE